MLNRFTIHVGCNTFKIPGNDLRGCLNDARLMDKVLTERLGEPVDRVFLENPAKQQVVAAWQQAAAAVRSGRCNYVTASFSTHGIVIESNRPSNFVQALVFSDADRNGNGLLLDTEFRDLIDAIPQGVRVLIWLDACHSRTGTRSLGAVTHQMKPRSLGNPDFMRGIHTIERSALDTTDPDTVVAAACDDPEEAADALIPLAGDMFYGAYTWYWCQAFRRNPDASHRTLCALTTDSLAANGFNRQHPQLSEQ